MDTTTELPRIFQCEIEGKKVPLTDPNPMWSPEAVMDFYAGTYPFLVSAKCDGPTINNDSLQYAFTSVMGTKG